MKKLFLFFAYYLMLQYIQELNMQKAQIKIN